MQWPYARYSSKDSTHVYRSKHPKIIAWVWTLSFLFLWLNNLRFYCCTQKTFSVKDQKVTISDVGHSNSVTTARFSCSNARGAVGNAYTNECGCVPITLYSQNRWQVLRPRFAYLWKLFITCSWLFRKE